MPGEESEEQIEYMLEEVKSSTQSMKRKPTDDEIFFQVEALEIGERQEP